MEKRIYLAGGCFWGMERLYRALPGIKDVTVGYANGVSPEKANYEAVCLEHLLFALFAVIDPETPNRQGPDVGSQYQTGVYWVDGADEDTVRRVASLEAAAVPYFAVELKPLENFYPAEEYHQRYLEKHPRGYCHISPVRMETLARFPFHKLDYCRPAKELLRAFLDTQAQ